ncbi:hypothetical protein [Streptomyces sp. IB2014 016-6]|uniref:hypothetical protein n=1 Tax=Streptomyces sp. IB2014 016-6 TaxID=2517818 RepID=UPI0011C853EE|nr:hypothetical protein [Streptomyces sp. IB2014 016-6]TXL83961.1 hypothetical protein EW053_35960 [Streptomyces sp. IB2014 016-6]
MYAPDAEPAVALAVTDGNTLSVATPEHAVGVVDLARRHVDAVLGDGAENFSRQALSDHALRLRGCLLPLCREVKDAAGAAGERLVNVVLALVDAYVPAGVMELRVRTVRLAQGVRALLDVVEDGVDPAHLLYGQPHEVSATDVREAIRLARSWQESGIAPHRETLLDVSRQLGDAIGVLLPGAELYRAGLPLSSPVREACADAEDLAAADVPGDQADAVAHVAALGEFAHRLLPLAESGERRAVLSPFELRAPIVPPVPMRKQLARSCDVVAGGRS